MTAHTRFSRSQAKRSSWCQGEQLNDETDTGGVSITNAVSINGQDAIERADGKSWTSDGFAVGQSIVVTGSVNNDGTYQIAGINGNTLILAPGNVVFDETDPAGQVSVDGPSTISRNDGGSFVTDGLTPGQIISLSGSANNDRNLHDRSSLAWIDHDPAHDGQSYGQPLTDVRSSDGRR